MASLASTDEFQKLEKQLTCPLCLELYREPRILACHHVYCSACLQEFIDKVDKGAVTCPECRKKTEVTEGKAECLAPAFSTNTLREIFDKLQMARSFVRKHETLCTIPHSDSRECHKHRSQSLDLYCQDCDVLVCRDCLLADKQHAGHSYVYVSELGAGCRRSFEEKQSELREVGERLAAAMKETSQTKTAIDRQEATITKRTTEAFDTLIEVLRNEKQRMLAHLRETMQRKQIILSAQEEALQAAHRKLEHEEKLLTTTLTTCTDQQLFGNWSQIEMLDGLTETLQMLTLSPLEEVDVAGINTVNPDTLQEVCRESTGFLYAADVSKTRLEGEGFAFAQTNKVAQFQVQLEDVNGDACIIPQDVTAELRSLRNDLHIIAAVTTQDPSCYNVTYMVETVGRYELSILVNRKHMPHSPFPIRITKPPHQIRAPCIQIPTLRQPTGIAVVGEKLYVSEYGGNRVSIFNSKLEKLHSIDGVPGPLGVTVDHESHVYVCSVDDHQVYKYGVDNSLMRTVGGEGRGKYNIKNPKGLHCHDKKVYVCDSDNNRIKILDDDLNLLNVYGKKGKGVGQFNFPCDIDVDSRGMIYVVDGHNHRIQVFNKNWKLQRIIGKEGKRPGELLQPVCIHIDDEQVFVTEFKNNRISVFSTSGQFLATFGERYLRQPSGLAIDQDGLIYVTHSGQSVLVFC